MNVASQAGLTGNADLPAYVASKHGVVGLSKCVRTPSTFNLLSVLMTHCRTVSSTAPMESGSMRCVRGKISTVPIVLERVAMAS